MSHLCAFVSASAVFIGGATKEPDGATFDDVSNKMKANVDVFRTRVVLVVLREFYC